MKHGLIQKIRSGLRGLDVLFFQTTYFTEGHTNLYLETRLGPIASQGGSVPVCVRKPITICDFPGGFGPLSSLWIRPFEIHLLAKYHTADGNAQSHDVVTASEPRFSLNNT